MKKVLDAIARDLWVVLLDIVSVNAAYFLALIIRFYVNFQLRPIAVDRYLPALLSFAPWYTVLSILTFMLWRLYGGLWRYAGVNDMNRIIGASVTTSLIHVAGTLLFYTRMPITYYAIGTVLQFAFITASRFSYRILLVEKKKFQTRKLNRQNVLVVGSGEDGRRVVKHLEESDLYRPAVVYSTGSATGTMDGIPIRNDLDLTDIQAVFIADPLLTMEKRKEISRLCEQKQIELQDYTGYFTNLGGRLSLTELMSVIDGPVKIVIAGRKQTFESGEAALAALTERYAVKAITGEVEIRLERQKKLSTQEALAREYMAVMGEEYDPEQVLSTQEEKR